jgi:hypothetical protein
LGGQEGRYHPVASGRIFIVSKVEKGRVPECSS